MSFNEWMILSSIWGLAHVQEQNGLEEKRKTQKSKINLYSLIEIKSFKLTNNFSLLNNK